MKEQIYTIPVTDAFREESECPNCVLEKKLEEQYIEYFLGASLMESDCRVETNKEGFCRRHFELLYNKRENSLGLGLVVDTHLKHQNELLKKAYDKRKVAIEKEMNISLLKNISDKLASKKTTTDLLIEDVLKQLNHLGESCAICRKMDYTMSRYADVIFFLWSKEKEFRDLFNSKKGFCLVHFRQLLEGVNKYLSYKDRATFVDNLMKIQLKNMDRMQHEVNWFTEKFDYRNNDAPWGNSKDALPRSIQKISGYSDLK